MSEGGYAFVLYLRGAHACIRRVQLPARSRATLVDVTCCQPRLDLVYAGAEVNGNA
jgi:hypothetical protein